MAEGVYEVICLTGSEGKSMTIGRVAPGKEIKASRVLTLCAPNLGRAILTAGDVIHASLEGRHRRTRTSSLYLERVRSLGGAPNPACSTQSQPSAN